MMSHNVAPNHNKMSHQMSHTQFNITQCAKMAGVNRKTIQRKISSGMLSAKKDANGKPYVELSELLRVYPSLSHPKTDNMSHDVAPQETVIIEARKLDELIDRIASLEKSVNSLTMRLEDKRDVINQSVEEHEKYTPQKANESYSETLTKSDSINMFDLDDLSLDNNLDMLGK